MKSGWSHYFYGGAPGVAERLITRLQERYPELKVVGTYCPPYRPLTQEEDKLAVNQINQTGADIVWVGLSTPKQERWMAEHLGRLRAPVMLGAGDAFDFHAGLKKQAPHWVQRSGLEWLFRLLSEPNRLWKSFLTNSPQFILLAAAQMSGIKKYARPSRS